MSDNFPGFFLCFCFVISETTLLIQCGYHLDLPWSLSPDLWLVRGRWCLSRHLIVYLISSTLISNMSTLQAQTGRPVNPPTPSHDRKDNQGGCRRVVLYHQPERGLPPVWLNAPSRESTRAICRGNGTRLSEVTACEVGEGLAVRTCVVRGAGDLGTLTQLQVGRQ